MATFARRSLRYAVSPRRWARSWRRRHALAGHDIDVYDDFCEHLIVRAPDAADGEPGEVIGTHAC